MLTQRSTGAVTGGRLPVVPGEDVVAEVAVGVAPHRVDVVHTALGVVVLGEQPGPLDPVVVRLTGLDAAGPGEVERLDPRARVLRRLGVGERVGDPADVDVEEGAQQLALASVSALAATPLGAVVKLTASRCSARSPTAFSARSCVARIRSPSSPWNGARHTSISADGRSPSATRGRLAPTRSTGGAGESTAAARCSGSRERTSSRARSSAPASGRSGCGPSSGDEAGSAPRNSGVDASSCAVDDQVVERDVVAAEPPRPRAGRARLAEHAEVVQPGIAATLAVEVRRPALQLVEHVLQPDDRRHRDVAGAGEPGGDELEGQALLGRTHRRQGQPAVVGRRVEPAPPFVVGRERPRRELGAAAGRGTAGRPRRHRPSAGRRLPLAHRPDLAVRRSAPGRPGPSCRRPASGPRCGGSGRATVGRGRAGPAPTPRALRGRRRPRPARPPAPSRRRPPWPCPPRRGGGRPRRRHRQADPTERHARHLDVEHHLQERPLDGRDDVGDHAPAAGPRATARISATCSSRTAPGGTDTSCRMPAASVIRSSRSSPSR